MNNKKQHEDKQNTNQSSQNADGETKKIIESFKGYLITYDTHGRDQIAAFNGAIWKDLKLRKLKQIIRSELKLGGFPSRVRMVLEDLMTETFTEDIEWRRIPQEWIPLKDCIWDCRTDSKVEYTPQLKLKNKIEVCNYEIAVATPVWDQVMADWFTEDGIVNQSKITLLHEIIGYCLTQRNLLKKAFVLKGPKNTGKTLLGTILTEIIGEAYVSCTKLANLTKDFGLSQLPDKMLNIDDEPLVNGKQVISEEIFKMLISPEVFVEVNKKNQDPQNVRLICKFLILANKPPRIYDDAAYDRLIFLEFKNSIDDSKIDRELKDKLKPEYNGIIAKAIEAFSNLVKRNYQFTVTNLSSDDRETYKQEADPFYLWTKTALEYTDDMNDRITNLELLNHYNSTRTLSCFHDAKLPKVTPAQLTKELNRQGLDIDSRHNPLEGTNTRHCIGYKLVNLEDEPNDSNTSNEVK